MVRINPSRLINIGAISLGLFALAAYGQQPDPPSRVARLNYINGNVSMEPAGIDDWAPAAINRPFTTGDYLYTDNGAQAELHMDVAVMRLAPQTSFGFLNLDDQTVQIKLSEGEMSFRIRNLGQNQIFEVDTPNAAISLLRDGVYRFSVDPNNNTTLVVVRQGQAEVTGGGQAFTLNPGNSAGLSGSDQLAYDIENDPGADQFDNWVSQRDAHEMRSRSAHYLPPSVIGYEDLDDYGGWQSTPDYGDVWYPNQVDSSWAPYHDGHWAWIEPWGYTWVDSAPWGFAPFHYGRWAYIGNRWGWAPGPTLVVRAGAPMVRPCYAPALVTFFGGSNFGVSLTFGGGYHGQGLGWVPLGYGEVYAPPYHVSPNYFRQVNVSNTRINQTVNITNVYNNVYVNKTYNNVNQRFVNMNAPGGVVAMPRDAFASGRPVRQAGIVVPSNQVARLQGGPVYGLPVAPTRQAFVPTQGRGPAPRPAAQIVSRPVVAMRTPPPPPQPFAARQAYLQQNAGKPLNAPEMHRVIAGSNPAPAAAAPVLVRPAPAARPIQAQVGQRVGNPVPFNRPGAPVNRPGAPAAMTPNQPNPVQAHEQQRGPAMQPQPNRGVPPTPVQPNQQRPGFPPTPQQQAGRPVVAPPAPAVQQPHGLAPNQRPVGNPVQTAPPRVQPMPNQPQYQQRRPETVPNPVRPQVAAPPPTPQRPVAVPQQPVARPQAVPQNIPPPQRAPVPQPQIQPRPPAHTPAPSPQSRPQPEVRQRSPQPAPPRPQPAQAARPAPNEARPAGEVHGRPPSPQERRAPEKEKKPEQ